MNRARYLFAFGYKQYHSMARANLNKNEWPGTNTAKASEYMPQNLHELKFTLSDPNLLSKSNPKCEIVVK